VRETDLRSLERPRMYSIFAPLDADEPLPREQLLAGRRYRNVGRWELAGALWFVRRKRGGKEDGGSA